MSSVKHIFITRHGHTDFDANTDIQRVLTSKGIGAVGDTANFIREQCISENIVAELCISSAAIRTKQTADIICKSNNIQHCDFHQELYCTTASKWLDIISQAKESTLVIVGHNPTFSQLVNVLCGEEIYMQPANCAFVTLELKPDGFVFPATLNSFYHNE